MPETKTAGSSTPIRAAGSCPLSDWIAEHGPLHTSPPDPTHTSLDSLDDDFWEGAMTPEEARDFLYGATR